MTTSVKQFLKHSGLFGILDDITIAANNDAVEASTFFASGDFDGGKELTEELEVKAKYLSSQASKDLFEGVFTAKLEEFNDPAFLKQYSESQRFLQSKEALEFSDKVIIPALAKFAEECDRATRVVKG